MAPRVNAAGSPAGPALNDRLVPAYEATAAVIATVALGIMLLCLAWAGRWVLNRRRLAGWEAAWAAVGPQWARRSGRGASGGSEQTMPVMRGGRR